MDYGSTTEVVYLDHAAPGWRVARRPAGSRAYRPAVRGVDSRSRSLAHSTMRIATAWSTETLSRTIFFDDDGFAIVTDFGIATARRHGRLTGTGRPWGRLTTCHPSRPWAAWSTVGATSTSLGIMLYEMLLGFPPSTEPIRIPWDTSTCTKPRWPRRSWTPVLPAALSALVLKCLAKSPDERFQRGTEVADALIAYLGQSGTASAQRLSWLARRTGTQPVPAD